MANLCGANEALDNALSKLGDLKSDILGKLELPASEIAASLNNKLTELKSALDGLAIDLPSLPDVNLQAEITGAISDIDQTTIQGKIAFASKLAKLKLDFGDTVTELGLDLDKLIVSGTSLISGGGDICALIPNLDISAANSGTGVTTEEIVERSSTANLTLTQTPKEILSVQGKKTGTNFFSNINFKQNGLVIVPSSESSYAEIKVTYLISLIKQKPVNSKQADKKEEQEEVSTIIKNVNVESIKTELKAKGDAVKSGTSFTATTKSTPIVTSTGRVIEASTTKDLVTKNAKGQKVRATKSAAGIAGKFKIIKDAWYNPTNLGAHPFDAVVYNNVDTLEKATAIFVSKKYKISDDLSNHKWSNYPPVEILTYFFMFWQPNYDKYSINELKEIQAQGTAATNAAADWDIDFIKTNADGSVQSGIADARRKAGGVGSEGFDMDYFGKTEQMQAIKSFKGKPQIFAFYFKYKVLDTTDSNYE